MYLSIIVAAAENNVIGRNNQLPWHLPADLKYFKQITMGKPIIMGRKTYASIGRPLPGRTNIVITRQADFKPEGVMVVSSVEAAIGACRQLEVDEAFITGGAEIFRQALPFAQRIYLTRVQAQVEGDTYFPSLDPAHWRRVRQERHVADEKNMYDYTFEVWEKNQRMNS